MVEADNNDSQKMSDTIIDYVTGKKIANIGPEISRQEFEKILVEEKGYLKEDIRVDEKIKVMFKSEEYVSTIDLVVFCSGKAFMGVKCVAGSLASYEREIIAGSRLVYDYQIPLSVSTNGMDALITNTITGENFGRGIKGIPSKKEAEKLVLSLSYQPFPEKRKEREMIIFRSYNMDKVNSECG